jgi:hypothetical protein
VNAFDRLQIVRASEFLILGFEIQVVHRARQALWSLEFALDEGFIDDPSALTSVSSLFCQASTCFRIGSKLRCMRSTPARDATNERERSRGLVKKTGVNTPGTMFSYSGFVNISVPEANFLASLALRAQLPACS